MLYVHTYAYAYVRILLLDDGVNANHTPSYVLCDTIDNNNNNNLHNTIDDNNNSNIDQHTTQQYTPTHNTKQHYTQQVLLLAIIVHALTHGHLPPLAKTVSYGCGLYFFLGMLMDGLGTVLTWLLGMPIAPHFNSPFSATSLADLWGRRWNLTAGGVLRRLLYDPLVEGVVIKETGVARARRAWMRAPAALLCFVVSGVMHEVLWWYITGATTPHWAWFWFFTVHGLACVVEAVVARWVGAVGGAQHAVLGWMWTMGFFVTTGHLLFVPPPESAGVADMVVTALREMYDFFSQGLVALYVRPVAPHS